MERARHARVVIQSLRPMMRAWPLPCKALAKADGRVLLQSVSVRPAGNPRQSEKHGNFTTRKNVSIAMMGASSLSVQCAPKSIILMKNAQVCPTGKSPRVPGTARGTLASHAAASPHNQEACSSTVRHALRPTVSTAAQKNTRINVRLKSASSPGSSRW